MTSMFSKPKSVDYAAIEAQRKAEAEAAEKRAQEASYQEELEKSKVLRGRGALMLSSDAGKGTLG